ncbi:MAG: magnesium transporter [Clostridia bacterium]|nr:magnesium transporter [Clostridia bacterium]
MSKNGDLLAQFKSCLQKGIPHLQNLLKELQPVDIADLLTTLEPDERALVFDQLDLEKAALVLNELSREALASVINALGPERMADILEAMSSDDAADILGELSTNVKDRLLSLMESEEARDVRGLLGYPPDTAGGLMTTEYVAIKEDITAGEAIEILRATAPDAETVYYIYVVNSQNQLVGVVSLRELIIAPTSKLISEIMHRKVISVTVDMDQEEVARIVSRYDFLAVPVVDHERKLLGIVTVDDVIDVIQEEATEDIYLLAGTSDIEEERGHLWNALRSRLPWLIVTMLEGMVAGVVLRGIEQALQAMVALAFFIPLLTGMGGNVGTQSATLTVRGLATGQINSHRTLITVFKEVSVGASIGLFFGVLVGLIASFWQQKPVLGLIVGLAMLGNMTTAATMGTLVPMFFKRVGIDPAVASAPFISASIDITGLLIYASLATLLIRYLV